MPVVVGGTAEEYWGGHEYHETDLDLVGPLTEADRQALAKIGLERHGRFWIKPGTALIVEFPEARLDGDEQLVHVENVEGSATRIIGLDDLYIDRLKQATTNEPQEDIHFQSALAVAASRFEELNWQYVDERIARTRREEPIVGDRMLRINSKIRARVRRQLADPGR